MPGTSPWWIPVQVCQHLVDENLEMYFMDRLSFSQNGCRQTTLSVKTHEALTLQRKLLILFPCPNKLGGAYMQVRIDAKLLKCCTIKNGWNQVSLSNSIPNYHKNLMESSDILVWKTKFKQNLATSISCIQSMRNLYSLTLYFFVHFGVIQVQFVSLKDH